MSWLSTADLETVLAQGGYRLAESGDSTAVFRAEYNETGFIVFDVSRGGVELEDFREALDGYGVSSDLITAALADLGYT